MKTNVRLLSAIALLASACTTGSMVTSGGYSDDVYFTPGDHPPVTGSVAPVNERQMKGATTISGLRQEEAGKIVDNYLSDTKEGNLKNDSYVLGDQQLDSDTIYESDEEAKDFINSYDDPEEISYSTRIRTFHNPYSYDPYWDSFYTPGWGFSWGAGYGGFYGGLYSNWYNPYFGGWYDPWYSYGGWGGYYPWWGGYYGGGYWGGSYWGGGYGGGGYDNHRDRYYGRQNYTGRGGSNSVRYGGTGGRTLGSSSSGGYSGGRTMAGSSGNTTKSANIINNGGASGGRQATGITGTGSTRQVGTRYTVDPNITRGAGLSGQSRTTRNTETITNLRRGQSSGVNSGSVRQGSTSNSSGGYTPTYSRPRTNIQSTYNSGTTRQYSRPQSSGYSGSGSSNRYSRPQGYSGTGNSGNSSSGSSYQRGSSRSSSGYSGTSSGTPSRGSGTYSGSSGRSSSSGSYSAPSRSSSSGGGGGYSGGGGGGGYSGGGGGGSGRRH